MPRSKTIERGFKDADGSLVNRTTFTITELNEMFGDQAFDNKGNSNNVFGFGLRVPIPLQKFHNKVIKSANLPTDPTTKTVAISELQDYFENSFEKVIPTKLVIDFSNKEVGTTDTGKNINISQAAKIEVLTEDAKQKLEDRAKKRVQRKRIIEKKEEPVVVESEISTKSVQPEIAALTQNVTVEKPKSTIPKISKEAEVKGQMMLDMFTAEDYSYVEQFLDKNSPYANKSIMERAVMQYITDVSNNQKTELVENVDFVLKVLLKEKGRSLPTQLIEQKSIDIDDAFYEAGLELPLLRGTQQDLGTLVPDSEVESVVNRYNPKSFKQLAYQWLRGLFGKTTPARSFIKIMDGVALTKMAGKEV